MDYKKVLLHDPSNFERTDLVSRQKKLKLNNLARMELFLWDLEIFLHVQELLKDKVALRGGAAAQFYLPKEYQRTSVDIDLVCSVDSTEIQMTVEIIEKKFESDGALFKFRKHKPKNPKTDLPLYTYYVSIPSVCSDKELFGKESGIQEIKVEFYTEHAPFTSNIVKNPELFAFKTSSSYRLLEINALLGDKLTTFGPNTIGIPAERADEQIKQIYDIFSIIQFNYKIIDFEKIRKYFIERAQLECKYRKIGFKPDLIYKDILLQLEPLTKLDSEKNPEIIKLINDFQGLYLRKSITKDTAEWSNIGAFLKLLFKCFSQESCETKNLISCFDITEQLKFKQISGLKRGEKIKTFKELFLSDFAKLDISTVKSLKGRNQIRIFWMLVTLDNIESIKSWVNDFIKSI